MRIIKHHLRFALLFLLLSSFLCPQTPHAQVKIKQEVKESRKEKGNSIVFIEGSLLAAVKKARMENKYIFVDAYASWCGPCKQLKNTTFKDKRTAVFFNANFVNLSIDMETGEGVSLAGQWNINEYPTLLILNAGGNVISRQVGFLDAKQLMDFGAHKLLK